MSVLLHPVDSVASLLDRRQAIFTGPVDLHPGAVEYYRDQRD